LRIAGIYPALKKQAGNLRETTHILDFSLPCVQGLPQSRFVTLWEKGATAQYAKFSDGFCPKTSKVELVVTAAGHSAPKIGAASKSKLHAV